MSEPRKDPGTVVYLPEERFVPVHAKRGRARHALIVVGAWFTRNESSSKGTNDRNAYRIDHIEPGVALPRITMSDGTCIAATTLANTWLPVRPTGEPIAETRARTMSERLTVVSADVADIKARLAALEAALGVKP